MIRLTRDPVMKPLRFLAISALVLPLVASAQRPARYAQLDAILKELVEINTSDSAGHTDVAARAMAKRLTDAGFPAADVQVIGESPRYQCLVARYRGKNPALAPILMIAHLDVVDARREDWSTDPYTLVEKDGWFYGRGTMDDKQGDAILIATLLRMKQDGIVPDRDLIVALTADEETSSLSIQWLIEKNRPLINAAFALNLDEGAGEVKDGKNVRLTVQTAEKVYVTYELEVRNSGGHSSLPVPDNAIYRLSRGLDRLSAFTFPVTLNETTRAFFQQAAATQPPAVAADMRAVARNGDAAAAKRLSAVPFYNAVLRTTCVATRLFAGHADNALPQVARATVNCRLLPGYPPDSATAQLRRIVGDTAIHVRVTRPATPSPVSPLRPDVMGAITRTAAKYWPGAVIVPQMSTGATDGLYLRNAGIPVYGTTSIFDTVDGDRSHGRDERIPVEAFHTSGDYFYDLVKALAADVTR
jgi:acetylornithine deacetylase/succinyl-diaminopimelate desuccinylase-like protein